MGNEKPSGKIRSTQVATTDGRSHDRLRKSPKTTLNNVQIQQYESTEGEWQTTQAKMQNTIFSLKSDRIQSIY
jgi:hypothetical protein